MPGGWCLACGQPIPSEAPFCGACGWVPEPHFTALDAQPAAAPTQYANFGQRLAAHLIDQVAILATAYFVGRPFGAMLSGFLYGARSGDAWEPATYVGVLLVAAFASFVFEVVWVGSHLQATPGKCALHLKVTDRRGKPLGFSHAFVRYLSKGLSGTVFCIGFLIQPFTEKKQALHDLVAGTLVVKP